MMIRDTERNKTEAMSLRQTSPNRMRQRVQNVCQCHQVEATEIGTEMEWC